MELPTVKEVCEPRDDILSGASSLDLYAASLSQVIGGRGPEIYQDPQAFFANTYPTEGLKTTVKEVFTRLAGSGSGSPVIKLETSLGGGKTHALIALYHLARNGSRDAPGKVVGDLTFEPVRVAAIVGTELATVATGGPATLWGEIARQLGRYEAVRTFDERRSSPGKAVLRELFGKERTLILVDEIAVYLAKASGVEVGDSTLAKATIAFLQELTETASELDNVSLVITSLDIGTVFGEETAKLREVLGKNVEAQKATTAIQDAKDAVSRVVRNLTPTQREEFPRLVQHRLFKNINRTAALEVCRAYHADLNREGVKEYMPSYGTESRYLTYLQEAYPFHPEFVDILRKKTSSIAAFNQTRGVLRLLGLLVQHLWKGGDVPSLIHAHHLDLSEPTFRDELISRLDRAEYLAAVTQDIADRRTPPRASLVDEEFSEPLGTWVATTAFLHSLTGLVGSDARKGANESELQLALHRPGRDPKAVERALAGLEDRCFYLLKTGSMYAFHTEPNLNRIIEDAKETVEGAQVLRELERRIEHIYGGRRHFDPRIFANDPSMVPDDTGKPKLVVCHFNEVTTTGGTDKVPDLVRKINETHGTQGKPRVFANNLLFLVADKEEVEKMEVKAQEYLALKKLLDDVEAGAPGVQDLSASQRAKLKERRQETELYLKVSIILAYKYLYLPASVRRLDDLHVGRPMRKLALRWSDTQVKQHASGAAPEEQYLLEYLKANNAALTADDEPWSPGYIFDKMWPKNADELGGDEFKKLFYKNPDADLIFSEDLVSRAMQRGVTEDHWYAIRGDTFYDKDNASSFVASFTPDLRIVRAESEAGKKAWQRFRARPPSEEEETPPEVRPSQPPSRLTWIEEKTLEGIVGELVAQLRDAKVSTVTMLDFKPKNRTEMARLVSALPQFIGTDITFDLDATLNRQHIRDDRGRPGNLLRLSYVGDSKGFNAVKSVLLNYEGKEPFSSCQLLVHVRWPEGISSDALIELLRTKVAQFTTDALYSVLAHPAEPAPEVGG